MKTNERVTLFLLITVALSMAHVASAQSQCPRVDYVCPADFWSTDFTARTEEFSQLAKGTQCKIYPSISPTSAYPGEGGYLSPAHYRGAARNFYAYGADGISAYNYFWTWAYQHGGAKAGLGNVWPTRSIQQLTVLKQPEMLAKLSRNYFSYPLWNGHCPTGAKKQHRLVVKRQHPSKPGYLRFRVAENLKRGEERAVLYFQATAHAKDEIELTLNGRKIPESLIQRKSGKKVDRYQVELKPAMIRFGTIVWEHNYESAADLPTL